MPLRIAHTVIIIVARMSGIMGEIIGTIPVRQTAGVQAKEGIVRKEKRPVDRKPAANSGSPALMVGIGRYGMRGRRRGKHIHDEPFVPAADLHIHRPAVRRRPVPVQHVPLLPIPVPLNLLPNRVDAGADISLIGLVKICRCRKQPLNQKR